MALLFVVILPQKSIFQQILFPCFVPKFTSLAFLTPEVPEKKTHLFRYHGQGKPSNSNRRGSSPFKKLQSYKSLGSIFSS
jgi:hypothetical protein